MELVVSLCGVSVVWPNISELDAWSNRTPFIDPWVWMRTASSMRSTPMQVMSPVSSGCLKESPTKLIAPRL